MIPLFRKIALSSTRSFSYIEEFPPLFDTPWHYHPEYELILIINSRGKRFMGDNISEFDSNELVLVGPNLPHFWRSDFTDKKNEELNSKAFVIHFDENCFGSDFFKLPEAKRIKDLLNKSIRGMIFKEPVKKLISPLIIGLLHSQDFDSIIHLLQLLNYLSKTDEYTLLSSPGFVSQFNAPQNEKMNLVYEFIMYHFKEDISLESVSKIACMEPSAFCRFFKKSTNKTFFNFLREIRIGYACQLLLKDKIGVSQICFECGFNNISNFNRHFKEVTKMKPLAYKKLYQNK